MSAVISKTFGKAGEGSASSSGKANLRNVLVSIVDDLAAAKTSIATLTAKLDADAANTALDDTDYAATCDMAALGTSYEA